MKENLSLVSVCMITYNHEAYIAQAIEGVLMQKTSFPIQLVIGEDCSTDNTRIICEEYKNKYPDIITLLLPDKNLGMRQNFITTLKSCTSEYIALCEGDDYWTDMLKLQKQIDFLKINKNYSACFHQVEVIYSDLISSKKELFSKDLIKQTYKFDEIIDKWIVATCSLVFVNFYKEDHEHPFFTSIIFASDRPLEAFLAKLGDFFYIDEVMSCYRSHSQGITKIGDQSLMSFEGALSCLEMCKIYPEEKVLLYNQVVRWGLLAAENSFFEKKYYKFIKYILFSYKHIRSMLGLKNSIKCTLHIITNKKIYE